MKSAVCACRAWAGSGFAKDDSGLAQIVRGQFHLYFVTGNDPNKVLSHFSGDVSEHVAAIRQVDPEHGAGEDGGNGTFGFYGIFLGHEPYFVRSGTDRQWRNC